MTSVSPGYHRMRVGEMIVTAIFDGVVDVALDAVTAIPVEEARRLQDSDRRPYPPKLPTSFFAVSSGDDTILIDAGGAPELDPELGLGRANLIAAGIDPDTVTAVLMTHLHTDHYGGLVLADGSAAFPRAELLMHADEHRHRFGGSGASATPPPELERAGAPYAQRLRMFESGSLLPGIEAVPLPGHTPGHTGYLLGLGDERMLIWGDVVHLPSIQFRHPQASMSYDIDPKLSAASRIGIFDRACRERWTVAGMHMDFPFFGRVGFDENAYRWES